MMNKRWELAQRHDKVNTRVNISQDNVKIKKIVASILRWALKMGLTSEAQLWRRKQGTSMSELQQKTRKEIQGLFS